ncbi:chalcone isomerase family protein [Mesonia ostreae]|uniref:Chalcone isomerase family protein n=1 Tax=Mesonia ostreae TaxID=861110 RepID=A0ABU2KGF0_9FLAO|nr:chalcone isomerase family protein [Mesonia ostreae]MDT0293780.1 chalcone isomerase family protein [Mesonia ostreae]
MNKIVLIFTVVFAVNLSTAQTKEVGGVKIPTSETFGEHTLSLNGAGTRSKLWIDLYVAGLYLKAESSNAKEIIEKDEAMAVKLQIVSRLVSSSKMVSAVEEGFENSTHGDLAAIQTRIDQFISFFKEEIKKGDVFDITYQPGKGVISYKNGIEKGVIEGMDFKKALFGIWLSKNPADDDLKENMLGK